MTAIYSRTLREPTPKGKRTFRNTAWGNTNVYVGGRFWETLGPTYATHTKERLAAFLSGAEEY